METGLYMFRVRSLEDAFSLVGGVHGAGDGLVLYGGRYIWRGKRQGYARISTLLEGFCALVAVHCC